MCTWSAGRAHSSTRLNNFRKCLVGSHSMTCYCQAGILRRSWDAFAKHAHATQQHALLKERQQHGPSQMHTNASPLHTHQLQHKPSACKKGLCYIKRHSHHNLASLGPNFKYQQKNRVGRSKPCMCVMNICHQITTRINREAACTPPKRHANSTWVTHGPAERMQ